MFKDVITQQILSNPIISTKKEMARGIEYKKGEMKNISGHYGSSQDMFPIPS